VIGPVLAALLAPSPLDARDARRTFDRLLAPAASDAERASILVALASRRDSPQELTAFAGELRRRARPFPVPRREGAIDLCGSGGAFRPSFNVSTVSAFVVAAAGAPVVKHGNASARGPCGSSDLLRALGLPIDRSPAFARESYRRYRLAFLHAPLYHPTTGAVGPARRLLGIPTLFNRLGPLSNPANVPFQVVGVPNAEAGRTMATALGLLGTLGAISMASEEGCDEFSPREETFLFRWTGRKVVRATVHPEEYLPLEDRRGSWGALPPAAAAEEARRILAGGGGARRGSVLLTSGAALWVSRRAPTLSAGLDGAREALDDGRAEELLHRLEELGARYAGRGEA
jgi:anthranilate phosphoribosyltransferase